MNGLQYNLHFQSLATDAISFNQQQPELHHTKTFNFIHVYQDCTLYHPTNLHHKQATMHMYTV